MKDFNYYRKVNTLYPNRYDYIKVYVYDRGAVIWEGSYAEWNRYNIDKMENVNPTVQQILDEEKYEEHRITYYAEKNKLLDEFKQDLFEDFEVKDNPKAERLFYYVYDRKGSDYEEFYDLFDELVEFIR